MKFIGQYIQDFIARFRSDVYLEDVSSGTIASGGNLGLDSNNKIVKANEPTSHDAVTLAGTPDYITLSGQEITRNAIDLANDVTGTLPGGNVATLNQNTTGSAASLTTERDLQVNLASTSADGFDGGANATDIGVKNALAVGNGGTGATTLTSNSVLTGNGTSAVQAESGLTYDSEVLNVGDNDDGDASVRRTAHSDEAGGQFEIRGGDAGGTDKAGGNLKIMAGRGTGSAAGGNVQIWAGGASGGGSSSSNVSNVQCATFKTDQSTILLGNLIFEGASPDAHETTFSITDPTDGRTVTVPDADVDLTKVRAATTTLDGVVELATTAETTTGTDTTRAVTPDGLKDGYQGSTNVTTLGSITTGEWRGTAIDQAYLSGQSGTNTGDEPDADATTKGIVELATTAEADTGTDTTRAITAAGLKSHVDARYTYQYLSFTSNATTPSDGDWMVPSSNGISNHLWNTNASNGSGGSSNGKTKSSSNITVGANHAGCGIIVPQACVLVGFDAMVRNGSRHANLGASGSATEYLKDQRSCGVFVGQPTYNDYAATGDLTLRAYSAQLGQGSPDNDFYLRISRATDMSANFALSAGDMIVPAIAGTKSDGNHHSGGCIVSWTLVLKTLIP